MHSPTHRLAEGFGFVLGILGALLILGVFLVALHV